MPITVNFKGIQPKTQNINNVYNIKTHEVLDDFVGLDDNYVTNFTTDYKEKKNKHLIALEKSKISTLPDYGTAIYFGIDLNNMDDTITKLKEINEEEKNDSGEPCIKMIKYTRISDSAIIPCKSIIDSTREFDSPIMPCKSIINSIRIIDSQIMKN